MTTTNDGYRVKRPLTADELAVIFAGIDAATNTRALLNDALRDLYTPLLADLGTSPDNINAEHPLRTTDYAIPTSQWTAMPCPPTGLATRSGRRTDSWAPSSRDRPAGSCSDSWSRRQSRHG